jgi:hypothetical protein
LRSRCCPTHRLPFGPGETRVAAAAGRRNRRQDGAGGGIDLVDARFGDLVEVRAVEGSAGVGGAIERARELAALRIDGNESGPDGGPDVMAVVGDAVNVVGAGEGAVFAHDLGRAREWLMLRVAGRLSGGGHRLAPFGASVRRRQSQST